MAVSKFVQVDAAGAVIAASTRDATLSDIFTTAISSDSAITGPYGLMQKAGLVVTGMSINAKRLRGSWNPLVN